MRHTKGPKEGFCPYCGKDVTNHYEEGDPIDDGRTWEVTCPHCQGEFTECCKEVFVGQLLDNGTFLRVKDEKADLLEAAEDILEWWDLWTTSDDPTGENNPNILRLREAIAKAKGE